MSSKLSIFSDFNSDLYDFQIVVKNKHTGKWVKLEHDITCPVPEKHDRLFQFKYFVYVANYYLDVFGIGGLCNGC